MSRPNHVECGREATAFSSGTQSLPGLRRRNEFRLRKAAAIAAALHMRISQFAEDNVLKIGYSQTLKFLNVKVARGITPRIRLGMVSRAT